MGETQKLPVEVIIWYDASKAERKIFEASKMYLTSIGFNLYEDDEQVVLFSELECRPDYLAGSADFTQIPKRMIVYREVLGSYAFKLTPPKAKRRRRAAADAATGSTALAKPSGHTPAEAS